MGCNNLIRAAATISVVSCPVLLLRRNLLALLLTAAVVVVVVSGQTTTTTTTTIPCYPTIGTVNAAMRTEQLRIQNGGVPLDMYDYVLCANTLLNAATEPLQPLLHNAVFRCGVNNDNNSRCVVSGGTPQVILLDSLVPGYFIQHVSFVGLTFSGFGASNNSNEQQSSMSVAAFASTTTTATFRDCVWENFASDFVIVQRAEKGSVGPMTVELLGGSITGGTTGVMLDNDGGLLRANQLSISDTHAAAVIATANNGASFLENADIHTSNVNSITYTTAGSTQSVLYTTVSRMQYMDDAFYVEGTGSSLLLEGMSLERNVVPTIPWNGVSVRTGAIARINESSISDNVAMEFGIVAFDSRGVWISDSFLNRNAGSDGETSISAPIFAITDAEVNMNRVEINENVNFSAMAVALIRSRLNIRWSCFKDSTSEFVIFVANDGRFDVSGNYVSGFSSQRCETTGPRLFMEKTGSGCFLGSNQCEGECVELGTEDSCQAQQVPTTSPTEPATLLPTTTAPVAIQSTWPPISPLTPAFQPISDPTSAVPTTTQPSASPVTILTMTPSLVPDFPTPPANETLTSFPTVGPHMVGPLVPTISPSVPSSARSRQPSSFTTLVPSVITSTPGTYFAPSTRPAESASPLSHDVQPFPPAAVPTRLSLPTSSSSPHASETPSTGDGKSEAMISSSGKKMSMGKGSSSSRSMAGMSMMMSTKGKTAASKQNPSSSSETSGASSPSSNDSVNATATMASSFSEGKGSGKKMSSSGKQHQAKGGKAVKRVMRAFRYTDGVNATATNATDVLAANTTTLPTRRRRG